MFRICGIKVSKIQVERGGVLERAEAADMQQRTLTESHPATIKGNLQEKPIRIQLQPSRRTIPCAIVLLTVVVKKGRGREQ
jgi:hypothetical protein